MIAKTFSATQVGIEGRVIQIEAVRNGDHPALNISGLPNDVVKQAKERVIGCLSTFGLSIPSSRIIVHLSPAMTKKHGSQLDVGIAMVVLAVEEQLPPAALKNSAFLGELSLDGRIHSVPGVISLLQALENQPSVQQVFLPEANSWEAALLNSKKAVFASHITDVMEVIRGEKPPNKTPLSAPLNLDQRVGPSIDSVVGHELAKRALTICLAGRHHLLMSGPPGVGKTLLASTAQTLLPKLSAKAWVEVVGNFSHLPHQLPPTFRPPFRSPHHSTYSSALLGGGTGMISPGEVSLASQGVLFLDELPEFRRDSIEGLREPLQSGVVHVQRVGHSLTLPAKFTLIAAMNPCPCGFKGSKKKTCRCDNQKVIDYQRKISGAILDRTDLLVEMTPPNENAEPKKEEEKIKRDIEDVIRLQEKRNPQGKRNGDSEVDIYKGPFALGSGEKKWFDGLLSDGSYSFRSLHKFVRVARTIADLDGTDRILQVHLDEAKLLKCSFQGMR